MNGRERYISTTQGGYSKPTPAPVSTGTPNFSPPGQGGNNLPPVVPTVPVVDGRSAALQSAADESANKYLTSIAEMATDEHGRLRNIYDLETNEPLLTFDDGKVVRTSDRGGGSGVVGDKGQLLSDLERMQLAALKMGHKTSLGDPVHSGSQFGSGLGSLITLDSEGNPMYTDKGELIYTGLGGAIRDNWNEILNQYDDPSGYGQGRMMKDIIDDYYNFDQSWYGSDWDEFLGEPYGGYPETVSMTDPKYWAQKGLGELAPTGFANLEQMYGEELANKMAAPHAWGIEPFSEMIIEGDY
jgi:hypothetical protein